MAFQLPGVLSNFVAQNVAQQYINLGYQYLQQHAVQVTAWARLGNRTRKKQDFDLLQQKHNDIGHELYELTAASERPLVRVMTTEPGVRMVEACPQNAISPLRAYYLPWDANKSYYMTLGNQANFFFTAPMNGCAFLVKGPAATPTVCHANYYIDPTTTTLTNEQRYERRRTFYPRLQRLFADSHMLEPDFYLKPNDVLSLVTSVFGFRNTNTGAWTFYYHVVFGASQPYANTNANVVVQHRDRPYFMTGQLWPTFHKPVWRGLLGHYLLG